MSKKSTKIGKSKESKLPQTGPVETKPVKNGFSRADLKKALKPKAKETQAATNSGGAASEFDDPIWRTIKKNSAPIKSGSDAYNLFQDKFGDSSFPEMERVKQPAFKPQPAPIYKPVNTTFAQADWTIGEAIRDRLRNAAIHGTNPVKPSNTISNLSAGRLVDLDRSTADKFRRGKLGIEGRLDLHGYTQDESMSKLARFVEMSYRQGKRCLIIVTGKGDPRKGGGVLKRQVPEWLDMSPNRDKILAISKAQPKDGGSGALYVLLKRARA